MWQNGGSSDTHSTGRSGELTGAYGNPSKRLHVTHLRKMRLTYCLAFKIQYSSLKMETTSVVPL